MKLTKPGDIKRPRVIELIGPAGAGKSSLLRVLNQSDAKLAAGVCLRDVKYAPAVALNAVSLLPEMISCYRTRLEPDWADMKRIVRLKTWLSLVNRLSSDRYRAVIFDEGPVFLLTLLGAFSDRYFQSPRFNDWFKRMLDRWSESLDAAIWLDAPDRILAQRIRSREKPHRVKDRSDEEVSDFLAHYRASYELTVSRLTARQGPKLIRLNTSQKSLQETADEALIEIAALERSTPMPEDALRFSEANPRIRLHNNETI